MYSLMLFMFEWEVRRTSELKVYGGSILSDEVVWKVSSTEVLRECVEKLGKILRFVIQVV